jgi:hypothetical protein
VIDFEPGCRKGGTLCELHRREMRDSYARRYFAPVGPGLILRGLTLRPATAAATRLFICGCQRTVGAEAITSADSSGARATYARANVALPRKATLFPVGPTNRPGTGSDNATGPKD